jgi:hypothetical protein
VNGDCHRMSKQVGNDNFTGDIMDCAYFTITTVLSKTDEDTKGPDEEQQIPDDETKPEPEEE